MAVNPQQRYLEVQVKTATPEKLVTMLYDGAIRFMRQAQKHLAAQDFLEAHNNLLRAQDILYELMANLNMEAGGEIAQNLCQLYDFMITTLIEANIKKDSSKVETVLVMLTDLRQTWVQAMNGLAAQTNGQDRLEIGS